MFSARPANTGKTKTSNSNKNMYYVLCSLQTAGILNLYAIIYSSLWGNLSSCILTYPNYLGAMWGHSTAPGDQPRKCFSQGYL